MTANAKLPRHLDIMYPCDEALKCEIEIKCGIKGRHRVILIRFGLMSLLGLCLVWLVCYSNDRKVSDCQSHSTLPTYEFAINATSVLMPMLHLQFTGNAILLPHHLVHARVNWLPSFTEIPVILPFLDKIRK